MRVAVLMRMYNVDKRLALTSIGSVLDQTHDDLVVYVYRDGGERADWMRDFRDDRVVYLESDANRGRAGAANALLDALTEDVDAFCFLDTDGDVIKKRFIEYAVRAAGLFGELSFWYVRNARGVDCYLKPSTDRPFIRLRAANDFLNDQHHVPGTWLALRSVISRGNEDITQITQGMGGIFCRWAKKIRFDERMTAGEDCDWIFRVYLTAVMEHGLELGGQTGMVFIHPPPDGEQLYFLYRKWSDMEERYVGGDRFTRYIGNMVFKNAFWGEQWRGMISADDAWRTLVELDEYKRTVLFAEKAP
jgi:glycosyltransferase involved in cell wall biosynthesis